MHSKTEKNNLTCLETTHWEMKTSLVFMAADLKERASGEPTGLSVVVVKTWRDGGGEDATRQVSRRGQCRRRGNPPNNEGG